jgi:hypothetical protein
MKNHGRTDIHKAFTDSLKFEESISFEHRFGVIKLHALRSREESSPTSSVTNQLTKLSTSIEQNPAPTNIA